MMKRRGTFKEGASPAAMATAFEKHLKEVYAWLDGRAFVKALRVPYHDALKQPQGTSQKIAEFLGIRLNIEAMTQQVDASLYRNRSE
jgi:hypothetical protein